MWINSEIKIKYLFPVESLTLDLHYFYFSALACNIISNRQSLITFRNYLLHLYGSFKRFISLKKGIELSQEYEIRSRLPGHLVLGGAQEIRSFLIHRTL